MYPTPKERREASVAVAAPAPQILLLQLAAEDQSLKNVNIF